MRHKQQLLCKFTVEAFSRFPFFDDFSATPTSAPGVDFCGQGTTYSDVLSICRLNFEQHRGEYLSHDPWAMAHLKLLDLVSWSPWETCSCVINETSTLISRVFLNHIQHSRHTVLSKKVGNSSLIRISNTILLGYNFQLDVFSGEVLKQKLNNGIKGSNRHLCLTLATSDIQPNAFAVVKGTNTEYPSYQFAQKCSPKMGKPIKTLLPHLSSKRCMLSPHVSLHPTWVD